MNSSYTASNTNTRLPPRHICPQFQKRPMAIPRAVGLAVLGKEKNEVDVGGEVELAATELSHADNDERLRLPA